MNKELFSDFSEVSSKQWKQKIQVDLKGADYNDALIWKTNEAIHVKPFYHLDEFKSFSSLKKKQTNWSICQSVYVDDVAITNKIARKSIKNGAESILFIIPNDSVSVSKLLKKIDLASTLIYFRLEFLSSSYVNQIITFSKDNKIHINTDIVGNIAKTGNWFTNLNEDHKKFQEIVKQTNSFSIDASLYQNSGATSVQQLAYSLAQANEYLNHLDDKISSEEKKSLDIIFNISVGTNYFFEIAKLRAFRLLWETLATEYGANLICKLFVTPTKRNKTLYDYNTNMLRTTTECMSAILGEADIICNLPYDVLYHKSNEFGERISRNQLLVLKHESYFDKVSNPSDGSYYIESLTNQLAEKALQLFKNIEESGGFLKQLKDGTIQRKIKESAETEQNQFNKKEIKLLGTNIHTNANDKMKDNLELFPFVKTKPRKTLIQPIIEKRLAEEIEQNRLQTE